MDNGGAFGPLRIRVGMPFDGEALCNNIRHAVSLGLPEVGLRDKHDGTLSIVASGPSLLDFIDNIKHPIYCVNDAHNELVRRGKVPDVCVLLDASPLMVGIVEPSAGVKYYVASQCDRALFDSLDGFDVTLWHAGVPKEDLGCELSDILDVDGPKSWIVNGGCTGALRCINIGYLQGFRKFRIYGLDSSFRDGESHFKAVTRRGDEVIEVEYRGRRFTTWLGLAAQAQHFEELYLRLNDVSIDVFGDGLIPHMAQSMNKARYGIDYRT